MISQSVYDRTMAAFQDRFKTMQPITLAMYYGVLNRELTEPEFIVGIERSLSWDGYGIPGPQQIIDLAKPRPSAAVEAAKAFEDVMAAFRSYPWQSFTLPDGRVRHAIIAAGGVKAMALADEKAAPHVRRTFIEAYQDVAADDESSAIAARTLASVDQRFNQLVTETVKQIGGSR